jgi:hypothetical protein
MRSISPTKREKVWQREKNKAYLAGLSPFPICIHCGLPVDQMKAWHVAHRKARAFKGSDALDNLGVAHIECNLDDGAHVVTPAKAKADAVRRHHTGADGPGLGKCPMHAGRRSHMSKKINGRVVERTTAAQRHAAMVASRALRDADGNPVGVWAQP